MPSPGKPESARVAPLKEMIIGDLPGCTVLGGRNQFRCPWGWWWMRPGNGAAAERSSGSVRQNLPPNTPALRHLVSFHRGVLERAERQNRSLKLVPHAMTDSGHHRPHQTPALASAKRFKSAGSPVAGQQVSTRAHLAIARTSYVPERERRVKRSETAPASDCVAVDALPSSIGAIGGSQATRPRWLRWMMVELHRRLRLSRGAQET